MVFKFETTPDPSTREKEITRKFLVNLKINYAAPEVLLFVEETFHMNKFNDFIKIMGFLWPSCFRC